MRGVIGCPLSREGGVEIGDGKTATDTLPGVKRRDRSVDGARGVLSNITTFLIQAGATNQGQQAEDAQQTKKTHGGQRKLFFHSLSAANTSTGLVSSRCAQLVAACTILGCRTRKNGLQASSSSIELGRVG